MDNGIFFPRKKIESAANFEARNEQNCIEIMICTQACYKLTSSELEMYQQYIDELRAKRGANFEDRNVQKCMKLWYARKRATNEAVLS